MSKSVPPASFSACTLVYLINGSLPDTVVFHGNYPVLFVQSQNDYSLPEDRSDVLGMWSMKVVTLLI